MSTFAPIFSDSDSIDENSSQMCYTRLTTANPILIPHHYYLHYYYYCCLITPDDANGASNHQSHPRISALDTMAYHRNRDVNTYAHWFFFVAKLQTYGQRQSHDKLSRRKFPNLCCGRVRCVVPLQIVL